MAIRLDTDWLILEDEQILEYLDGEGWTMVRHLGTVLDLPRGVVHDRVGILADAELVAYATADRDLIHLTAEGSRYLRGRRDQMVYPHPFDVARATFGVLG